MSALAHQSPELAAPPTDIRNGVREVLTSAQAYDRLDAEDRRAIANALVRIATAAQILEREAGEPARPTPARAMDAGGHFSGTAVDRMASTTKRMLNAISFPRFVSELINGVFKAMVETNQQQLQQYVELVRGVSQSLEGFSSLAGNDNMARQWLADHFPQSFSIEQPDPPDPGEIPDPDDEPEPMRLLSNGPPPSPDALRSALALEPGTEVPSDSGEALVPFVRQALAKNRQQMLATMVQMGMQRIVIDSGRINASMRFHIDATSAAAEDQHTGFDTRTTAAASASGGWGIWSASASVSSTIGFVSTDDVRTREDLTASADLNSSVEIHFRTDQVPLDRLASQQTVERLRLNTLNPEKELDIARQSDNDRMADRRQTDAAYYAAHPSAGPLVPAAPAAPPSSGGAKPASPGGGPNAGKAGGASGGKRENASGRQVAQGGAGGGNTQQTSPTAGGGTPSQTSQAGKTTQTPQAGGGATDSLTSGTQGGAASKKAQTLPAA